MAIYLFIILKSFEFRPVFAWQILCICQNHILQAKIRWKFASNAWLRLFANNKTLRIWSPFHPLHWDLIPNPTCKVVIWHFPQLKNMESSSLQDYMILSLPIPTKCTKTKRYRTRVFFIGWGLKVGYTSWRQCWHLFYTFYKCSW